MLDFRALLPAALLALLALPAAAQAPAPDLKSEAVRILTEYASTLQAALKAEIAKSGPVGAIGFCQSQAPQIAAEISQRSGWTVGRTALRLRNPASAPDAYETQIMTGFAARIAKGEAAAELSHSETITDHGQQSFRFIKAIPTGELCLTCHGTDLKPDIKAKLNELYPGDQATGFKLGDLRGVFTLRKKL